MSHKSVSDLRASSELSALKALENHHEKMKRVITLKNKNRIKRQLYERLEEKAKKLETTPRQTHVQRNTTNIKNLAR